MKTLREQFGITSYLTYGGGKGLYNPEKPTDFEERLFGFKLHRHFADNRRYVQGGGDPGYNATSKNILQVQRTPQGWYTDDYLQLLKNDGIDSMWTLQGKFPFQNTIGKATKVMPINEEDYVNQGDPAVWHELAKFAGQLTIRYASDTAQYLPFAEVYQNPTDYRTNTPKAGMGLLNIIQVLNEPNFKSGWSGATNDITAEGTAAAYVAVYKEIRKWSQTMRVVSGPPIGIADDKEFLQRMLEHMKLLFGGTIPSDVEISFHWYMRENNQSQSQSGTDTGASPEYVNAYDLGKYVNDLCHSYGIAGWWCTETGWAASSSIDKSKNAAPIQQGYTQLEAQGILMIRLMLIWASLDKHIGTTFWHCRDDYDAGGYAKGGLCLNDNNWTPKPARDISYNFLNTYGLYNVVKFSNINGNQFFAELQHSVTNDKIVLGWSDKFIIGDLTPNPEVITNVILPEPTGSVPVPTGSIEFPQAISLNLIEVSSGNVLGNLKNNLIYTTATSSVTVEAILQNSTGVQFSLSGSGYSSYIRTERTAPFVLFGDTGGVLSGNVLTGTNKIGIRAFNSENSGVEQFYNLTFVSESISEPTGSAPVPTGSLEPTGSVTGSVQHQTYNWDDLKSITFEFNNSTIKIIK